MKYTSAHKFIIDVGTLLPGKTEQIRHEAVAWESVGIVAVRVHKRVGDCERIKFSVIQLEKGVR